MNLKILLLLTVLLDNLCETLARDHDRAQKRFYLTNTNADGQASGSSPAFSIAGGATTLDAPDEDEDLKLINRQDEADDEEEEEEETEGRAAKDPVGKAVKKAKKKVQKKVQKMMNKAGANFHHTVHNVAHG